MVRILFFTTNVAIMVTETDGHGRLYLPKELRERYGERFHVVEYEDRIELLPVSDDPLSAVREAADELGDESVDGTLEDARETAKRDAEEGEGR